MSCTLHIKIYARIRYEIIITNIYVKRRFYLKRSSRLNEIEVQIEKRIEWRMKNGE